MTCGANAEGATCISALCGSTVEIGIDFEIGVTSHCIMLIPSEWSGAVLSEDSFDSVEHSFVSVESDDAAVDASGLGSVRV